MAFVNDTDLAAVGPGQGATLVGYIQAGINPTSRTAMDKLRESVSVLDFGGLLNDITSTAAIANRKALQNALATGKRVYIPAGRFYINNVVTLPTRFALYGDGPQVSTIYFGLNGQLQCSGAAFDALAGDAAATDLGFAIVDPGDQITRPSVSFLNVEYIKFDRCLFYHVEVMLDSHHYITFEKCRFFGDPAIPDMRLVSQCTSQPNNGFQNISENLRFIDCSFSSYPVELVDTVEPSFIGTQHFGGAFGIRSSRQYAIGNMPDTPFFMGPVLLGCTLDSIRGVALDVDYGGTNCRAIGCLFSAGRLHDDSYDPNNTMGVRYTNSVGVELVGCHFEWCGNDALRLANCQDMVVAGSTFLNQANGAGINATSSRRLKIVGNTFVQRSVYGGSNLGVNGNLGTQLAIVTPASDLQDSVVMANTISGMVMPTQLYLSGTANRVFANPGAPLASEQNWAPAMDTGWTAATGTALKGAYATYAGQTQPTSYSQAVMQTLDNAARSTSQRVKALEDAIRANRIIS